MEHDIPFGNSDRENGPSFLGAYHLVKISGISGSAVNGTRFVGSSHWKIPRKSGKSKKVVPFSRLEFPNGMSCSIYVSRTLYQFQVHGRAPPRTGVYDQMEQLFTNRKFHFCYHRNFRVSFLNGKRPDFPLFLGIFQWDEPTKRVPFTAEPKIPEILTKWKAPSISYTNLKVL